MGSCNTDSNQTKHIVKMFVTSATTAVIFHLFTAVLADQSSSASSASTKITYPWWLLLSSSVAVVLIVVSIYLTRTWTRTKTVVHDRSDIEAVLWVDGVENNDVVGYVAFTGSETVGYVTDVGNNPEIELAEKHPVSATRGWVSQKLEGLP